MARWAQFPAPRRWVVTIAAIGAVVAGSLTFWVVTDSGHHGGDSGPQTTVVRGGEVWLQGKIAQDTCYQSIPDTPCSITVNGYQVFIVAGSAQKRGRLAGNFTGVDKVGGHADVYAKLTGPRRAEIWSAPRYYARFSS